MDTCSPERLTSTYILNTSLTNFADAEASCQRSGGHLVSYSDEYEQFTVESCFLNQGSLLPNYHKFYWMGLQTGILGARWPNFTWLDHENAIYVGDYQHWGVLQPGNVLEPNNLVPSEDCAGSNLTMGIIKLDKTWGMDGIGGWADHNCQEEYVYICEVSPPETVNYTTTSTGMTFVFHAVPATQQEAEAMCNVDDGHLASYASLEEQAEVEQFFMNSGALIPEFHRSYWMGLVADKPLSSWRWMDFLPPPSKSNYLHWGVATLASGKSMPEPNNRSPPEVCAVANASQAYDQPRAWGWADANCKQSMVYVCKVMREWPGHPPLLMCSGMSTCACCLCLHLGHRQDSKQASCLCFPPSAICSHL